MAPSKIRASERRLRAVLGRNVRRLREEQGLPQTAGEAAGINARHWRKIEGGSVGVTLRTIAVIADVLDVPAWELLVAEGD